MPLFMASFRPSEAFVYVLQDPFCICLRKQQELVQYERFCGQQEENKTCGKYSNEKCVVLQVNDAVVSLRLVVFLSKVQGF